jgi:hypothetical protein
MNAKIVIPGERRIEDVARGKGIQRSSQTPGFPSPRIAFAMLGQE